MPSAIIMCFELGLVRFVWSFHWSFGTCLTSYWNKKKSYAISGNRLHTNSCYTQSISHNSFPSRRDTFSHFNNSIFDWTIVNTAIHISRRHHHLFNSNANWVAYSAVLLLLLLHRLFIFVVCSVISLPLAHSLCPLLLCFPPVSFIKLGHRQSFLEIRLNFVPSMCRQNTQFDMRMCLPMCFA